MEQIKQRQLYHELSFIGLHKDEFSGCIIINLDEQNPQENPLKASRTISIELK